MKSIIYILIIRFSYIWQLSRKSISLTNIAVYCFLIFSLCFSCNIFANNTVSNSVVIDNNNNIVLGGYINTTTGGTVNTPCQDFLIVRYTPEGAFDTTFNPNGQQPGTVFTNIFGFTAGVNAITIDSSNRIVAAGFANNGSNNEIALARYDNDGLLDKTFNPTSATPGIVTTNINGAGTSSVINGVSSFTNTGSNSIAYAVAIDNSNKIVVAGTTNNGRYTSVLVIRYNDDGSLDTTFNPNGLVSGMAGIVIITISNFDDEARGLAIDNNNNLVLAGFSNVGRSSNFLIIRLIPDGSIDNSFIPSMNETGTPGLIQIALNSSNSGSSVIASNPNSNLVNNNRGSDVVIDNNNNIVISGTTNNGNVTEFVVIRLLPSGGLDTTFNSTGANTVYAEL